MPGVVENYIREQNQKSFEEAYKNTRERLEERYFNQATANGWDAYLSEGKTQAWGLAERRDAVQKLSHQENHWIANAQRDPGSRYAEDHAYRHGARAGVIQFSRENNHELREAERERQQESQRIRLRVA